MRKRHSVELSVNSNKQSDAQDFDSNQQEENTPFMMNFNLSRSGLPTAQDLLAMNPSKYGYAMKKSNSFLSYILPCIFPRFKKRFFILIGNFLFRFSSEHGESPKGVPLPLDAITVRTLDSLSFEISMLRKTYVINAESSSECASWVAEIKKRQAQAIRENMGHAPLDDDVRKINKTASKLFFDKIHRDNIEGSTTVNPLGSMLLH